MTDNQLNPKLLRVSTWWMFGGLIGAATMFLLGGGYSMFVSAIIVGIMAGKYRRRIRSKIPAAAQMDSLNILAGWITANVLVILLFWWGNRLLASHLVTIPAATSIIAMFYYVVLGGRVVELKAKVLRKG
jgi:hypothetical protein